MLRLVWIIELIRLSISGMLSFFFKFFLVMYCCLRMYETWDVDNTSKMESDSLMDTSFATCLLNIIDPGSVLSKSSISILLEAVCKFCGLRTYFHS